MRLRIPGPRAALGVALAAMFPIAALLPSAVSASDDDPPNDDPVVCLVIDDDSIDNGNAPNFFTSDDVNDDIAGIGQRAPLRYWRENVGKQITLYTGQVGDEGWFQPRVVPSSWNTAGPTTDGLVNFFGVLHPDGVVRPGVGLGTPDSTGNNAEVLLDKIPEVLPLREQELRALVGRRVFAVVYDGDISINYDPLVGNLQGANLGVVAFLVLSVTPLTEGSSSSLPEVEILILDPALPRNQCSNSLD